jgi:hypothetical protein
MSEVQGVFVPTDMELDTNNKMGYIEHISYRLALEDCLPCVRKNGVLDNNEFRVMAEELLSFREQEDVTVGSLISVVLDVLRTNSPHHELDFVTKKEWSKFTKPQIGKVVAAAMSFPYLGDPHIGATNGVISTLFFSSILDALPDPDTSRTEYTKEKINNLGLRERKPEQLNAVELFNMLNDPSDNGIVVPEYQRHDTQWSNDKRRNLIDSMVKRFPIPSIVIAKHDEHEDGEEGPWYLIDGNQRLSTLRRFMDEEDPLNFDLETGMNYSNMPQWAKERVDSYEFNVEMVKARSITQLAELFHRYNTSGKSMTPVQIRVAYHHERSALHHLLVAMAGGPSLEGRDTARRRLNIMEYIEGKRDRAPALRATVPGLGDVTPDEATHLRRTTEKTYDLWCRIIGYALFPKLDASERLVDTDYPTAKMAIRSVFHKYRNGSTANIQALKLDYIIREASSLYGDFAFRTMRKVGEITNEDGSKKRVFERGKSVHGWATQIQCCAIWDFSDDELSLLKNNPDSFQTSWREFAEQEIAEARQNSASIWEKQHKWALTVKEIILQLRGSSQNISQRQVKLLEAVEIFHSASDEIRPLLLSTWEAAFSDLEREWMMKEIWQREHSA